MKKIHKILFVSYSLYLGGAERAVTLLSSGLAALGYEVSLIVYRKLEKEYAVSDRVNVIWMPQKAAGASGIGHKMRGFFALRKAIRESGADVVIPFFPDQAIQCYFAVKGLGIPLVTAIRNNPSTDPPNPITRRLRNFVAKRSRGIFLQNEAEGSIFSARVKKKCFVVPNPIGEDFLGRKCPEREAIRRFVSVGRFNPQKNHVLLIDAFAQALTVHPELTLDLVGSGKLENEIREKIREKGLEEKIRLLGNSSAVAEVLCEHDAFVLSSDYEGMPNALMEAMAVGLPCISTDCPVGPRELLGENERGVLVPVRDSGAMADAMIALTQNVGEAYEKGKRAADYAEAHFSLSPVCQRLADQIEKLL